MPPGVTISDSTTPSADDVAVMALQVVDEVNAHLRNKGFDLTDLPSDNNSLSFLNTVSVWGTLLHWAKAKYPADTGPGGDKGLVAFFGGFYNGFLDLVDKGALGLPDEPRAVIAHGFDRPMHIERNVFGTSPFGGIWE
jgi:hypothetical protein